MYYCGKTLSQLYIGENCKLVLTGDYFIIISFVSTDITIKNYSL